MEPLISVIVPVYNVEKYIEKCIDSILIQSYSNLEIILIDDGSTDTSGEICERFKHKDSRIIVIHKENGGLSDARNSGIDKATGEYITFIDSDDYISKDYIQYLYNILKETNSDISICNPVYVYENANNLYDEGNLDKNIIMEIDSVEALKVMLYQNYYDTSAWGKLYKIKLFKDIRYPVGKLFEDMGTTYKVFLQSTKIVFSSVEKYYYLQRNNSISNDKFNYKKLDYLEFAEEIYTYIEKNIPQIRNAAASRVISVSCNVLLQLPQQCTEYKELKRKLYGKIKSIRKNLIFDKNVRKKNKVIILLSYIPYCLFIKIFYMIGNYNKRTILK